MSNYDFKIRPNLIIGGVFKAGTTSLFSYLSDHNEISTSSKKELGYFVPIQFNEPLAPISDYLKYFKHIKGNTYVTEASPGYLFGGYKVAKCMKEVLGNFKIIFILREPESRLISFYKYLKTSYLFAYSDTLSQSEKDFIKKMTFNEYVKESLTCFKNQSQKSSHAAYFLSGVGYSLYSSYLQEWYDIIGEDNIKIIFFDSLSDDPRKVMYQICEWLGISHHSYDNYPFIIQNKTRNIKSKSLHYIASKINKNFETTLRLHPSIKNKIRDIYYYFNQERNKKENCVVSDDVVDYFNAEKKDLQLLMKKYNYKDLPSWLA